jgi:hypothetical protein
VTLMFNNLSMAGPTGRLKAFAKHRPVVQNPQALPTSHP